MKFCFFLLFTIASLQLNAQNDVQTENWSPSEIKFYNNVKALANYIENHNVQDISKDTIVDKYIHIEPIDNEYEEGLHREENSKEILAFIPMTLEKYGYNNLDVKPLRFYKDHKIYDPFKKSLKELVSQVMVYFLRDKPDEPLGTLLFDLKTYKLASWILINFGGQAHTFLLI